MKTHFTPQPEPSLQVTLIPSSGFSWFLKGWIMLTTK